MGATLLADAWVMLKRRLALAGADLEQLLADDSGGDMAAEVVRVLATAVLRVLKNPDGKAREAVDDYSWARDASLSAGVLYFTDDELDGLLPGAGQKGRAFMVDPLADYAARRDA